MGLTADGVKRQGQRLMKAFASVDNAVTAGQLTSDAGRNIQRWLTEPQYSTYRPQVVELVDAGNFDELNRLFWERIPFGTGGRRGPMSQFGSATINERTIAESAHGLAVYVLRTRDAAPKLLSPSEPRAVVAFDSRHRSDEFARRTACVLAAHGFHVEYFPKPRSTPELSFAILHLHCDTGVMISASHNPPCDNGFKAYWSTGGQILPPQDAGIIACVDAATEIPSLEFEDAVAEGRITMVGDAVDAAYVDAVCRLSLSADRDITALYTPLHGVGETSVFRVLQQAGFRGVTIFEPQRSQDGSFPNVPDQLPNPERFAVFDPAISEAKQTDVDLVLASDPDADRLAVAVRDRTGNYVCLTGNQLGALLVDYVLRRRAKSGSLTPDHYIIETLVTTPMIAAIGETFGVQVIREVLVGFKNIAGEIASRRAESFVFGAEESLGYMAGDYCRDKDAAVAALFAMELAAELKAQGLTLLDRLDELYKQYGYFLEETNSIQCPGPTGKDRISRIMAAFRDSPQSIAGGCVWESVRDFQQHEVRSLPSNRVVEQLPSPSGDLLMFSGRCRECVVTVAVRPSGTEPKIKFYYFIHTRSQPSVIVARERATECLREVQAALNDWMNEASES